MAFDNVPTWTSTLPWALKWSTLPRPLRPRTPEAWASSTIMMAPYFSASAASLATGPMSPSMEKTPSVMSSLWPGSFCNSFSSSSAWATSLWRKTLIFARDRRAPSMMLAWFSSSERMKSSLPRMAETVPALAAKPDWKTTQASTFLKAAILFFQLHVDAHGSGDGAHGAGADAVLLRGGDGGLAQLGVVAQAEVVVAGEVDDLAAVVVADGGLLVVEDAQAEVGAAGAQVVERGGQVGELGRGAA